jgi:hypothetical protein
MEPRVLMTTVVGGNVFTYLDPRGDTVHMTVTGNTIAEVLSSVQDENGTVLLGDLVGRGSNDDVLLQGTIGRGQIAIPGLADVQTNVRTIASNAHGRTFTFNLFDVDATNTVITNGTNGPVFTFQMIELSPDSGNVISTVDLTANVGLNFVNRTTYANAALTASAFNSFDQRLYFILRYDFKDTTTTGGTTTSLNELFAVDVNTDVVSDIGAMPNGSTFNYSAMSFVVNSPTSETLWIFRQPAQAGGGGAGGNGGNTNSGMVNIAIGSSGTVPTTVNGAITIVGNAALTTVPVVENFGPTSSQTQVTSLIGLAYVPGSLDGAGPQYIYGIEPPPASATANGDAHIVRIAINPQDLDNGSNAIVSTLIAINWGPANDGSLSGLTWNPVVANPFTKATGSLVSLDFAAPQMSITNSRLRIANGDAFAVYVTNADITSTITFEGFTTTTTGLSSLLYTGNPEGGTVNTGTLLMGAAGFVRGTGNTFTATTLTAGNMLGAIGGQPQLYTTDLNGLPANVLASGLVVGRTLEQSLNPGQALPQQQRIADFTHVTSMAVSKTGTIVAFDNVLNRIAVVDPVTGDSLNIANVGAGRVEAIAFGDPNLTGTEQLYAVIDQGDGSGPALGLLDPTTGAFTFIGSLGMGFHAAVTAIVFTPGGTSGDPSHQSFYAFADPDTLDRSSVERIYQVNPFTGAALNPPAINPAGFVTSGGGIGALANGDGTAMSITSATFDTAGRLIIYDRLSGRIMDLNVTTLTRGDFVLSNTGGISSNVFAVALDPNTLQTLAIDNTGGGARLAVIKANSETILDGQNLGRFLFDGVWHGQVFLSGSIDTFYSGMLLSGNNFTAAGDIRNLLALTSMGTTSLDTRIDPNTGDIVLPGGISGLTITAGGKIGFVHADGDFYGAIHASNQDNIPNLVNGSVLGGNVAQQREIQTWTNTGLSDPVTGLAYTFANGFIVDRGGNIPFDNRTFGGAQYLGTVRSPNGSTPDVIDLWGEVSGDPPPPGSQNNPVDYFGISLLAGQTVDVQVAGLPVTAGDFGIFDPDGRLIATDYNPIDLVQTEGRVIRFTADRPGVYRIAIAATGNTAFANTGSPGVYQYELTVTGIGDLGIGAVTAGRSIILPGGLPGTSTSANPSIMVDAGDIGVVEAGTEGAQRNDAVLAIVSTEFNPFGVQSFQNGYSPNSGIVPSGDITVKSGSLRTLVGGSLGFQNTNVVLGFDYMGPDLNINGTVGLLQSSAGLLSLTLANAARGDIQVIDAATDIFGVYRSNQAIGVIRSAQMGWGTSMTEFHANADNLGADGVIDLIDVSGDLGIDAANNVRTGGPSIVTGQGGNVRFMHVTGTVEQDVLFNTGQVADARGRIVHSAGSLNIIDDSGATISLTPSTVVNGTASSPGTLTTLTYGIRGVAGVVLLEVESTSNLTVSVDTGAPGRAAEVGVITVDSPGIPLSVVNGIPTTNATSGGVSNDIIINTTSGGRLDVFDIRNSGGGTINNIKNNTEGDILNITAGDIGSITTQGSLGSMVSTTGALINPIAVFSNTYPFIDQRFGIAVANVGSIISQKSIGNVLATGVIGTITANSQNVDDPNAFEGISGPIVINGSAATTVLIPNSSISANVSLQQLNIGEGIAAGGSGSMAKAGVFAVGRILSVSGTDGDIRGPIISENNIGTINLDGSGSIVNTVIGAFSTFDQALAYVGGYTLTNFTTVVDRPIFNINTINITGTGGIIGSLVGGASIGNITVGNSGFGILKSTFIGLGEGTLNSMVAGGYGIRGDTISFARVGTINATGSGVVSDLSNYPSQLRESEIPVLEAYSVNSFDGTQVNDLNDIDVFIQGDATLHGPDPAGLTTGVIERLRAAGAITLGSVFAYNVLDSLFAFNQGTGTVNIRNDVTTTQFQTATLQTMTVAGNAIDLDVETAGKIGSVTIKGDFLFDPTQTTVVLTDINALINAKGPTGDIGSVTINGTFGAGAAIIAESTAGTITVGRAGAGGAPSTGNFLGSLTVSGNHLTGTVLTLLKIFGDFDNGFINITGNSGTIDIAHSFTADPGHLILNGNVGVLNVGSDPADNSAVLAAPLIINGNVGKGVITGMLTGSLLVKGDLTNLLIAAEPGVPAGTDLLTGTIKATGAVTGLAIQGGISGSVIGGQNVSVTLTNGSLDAGALITSSLGSIVGLTITNGNLDGNLAAPNGAITGITVNGAGQGVGDTALITGLSIGTITVPGTFGGTVNVTQGITALKLGTLLASASIVAGSLSTLSTTGDLAGNLTIGTGIVSGSVSVGGNYTGSANFGSPVSVSISGNMAAGSLFTSSNAVNNFVVKGTLSGNLFVDRTIGTINAANIINAIITTGMGLTTLTTAGAINNSLIQVGVGRGLDGLFGTGDLGEAPRQADIKTFNFGNMSNSIVATGGSINSVKSAGTMTTSSISTGLVLSGAAINTVMSDGSPLNDATEMNTARQDAVLFRGSFTKSVAIGPKTGFGLNLGSALTAGVSPGADGAFGTADDNVSSSLTGGASSFGSLKATVDGTSVELAKTFGKKPFGTLVGYTLDNSASSIVASDPVTGSPTAIASAGNPVTITGPNGTITITVSGKTGATVSVYDTDTTNNYIETIVISGTDNKAATISVVTSAPGAFDIGRILATDNTLVSSFTFNGDLVGDPLGGPALWIDSDMKTFSVRNLPNDATWSGQIGGNVTTLTVKQLGPGQLRVGGRITTLNVTSSAGNPLLQQLGTVNPATGITQLTSNPLDNSILGSDGNQVFNLDTATGNIGTTVTVQNPLGDSLLAVNGISFAQDGTLVGVATINNQLPVTTVGSLTPIGGTRLTGLAVNATGQIFAVDLINGFDTLVQIDPTTGGETQIGIIHDVANDTFTQNILALAFDQNGNLMALVNDRDGSGVIANQSSGVALARIGTSDPTHSGFVRISNPTDGGSSMAPVLITGNVQGAFTGFAVDSSGNIFAVRHVGSSDELDQLTITGNGAGAAVTLTNLGNIKVDAGATDTQIVGMGFDENDNLIALNSNGSAEDLIGILTGAPGTSVRLTQPGVLTTTLNNFAIGKSGTQFKTYGYSTDLAGNTLYANPGVAATLGTIASSGPDMGTFLQLLPLLQDAVGTPLAGNVLGTAVDASNHAFVITDTGVLAEYSTVTGELVGGQPLGPVVDNVAGNLLNITRIAFDGSGRLIGLNAQENRLVVINTSSTLLDGGNVVLASGLTELGSVNASDLTSFTFDPIAGKFVAYSSGIGAFANILGTSPASLGGLTAQTIGTANVGSGFAGRIAATGNGSVNGIDAVKFTGGGTFTGAITSDGSIGTITGSGITLNGSVISHGNIATANLNGSIGSSGIISAADRLSNFSLAGTLAGSILAGSVTTLNINGVATESSLIAVHNDTSTLTVGGNELGSISLGSVNNFKISGQLGATGFVFIGQNAGTVALSGGTALNSLFMANQGITTLTLGGTALGVVGVRRSVGTLNVASMNNSVVDIGGDVTNLNVTGSMTRSLIGIGTWIGLDGVYNTADDVIFGGSLSNGKVSGVFTNSLITAGVMPRIGAAAGTNGIPADSRAYTGNPGAANLADVSSAETGGISPSTIKTLTFNKPVVSTNTVGGIFSAAVAADGIAKLKANSALQQAVLVDPVGAPTIVANPDTGELGIRFLPGEVRIVFNEPLDTATLTPQSVVVRDSGNNLINVTLAYTTQKAADGSTEGVLRILNPTSFGNVASLQITLDGTIADGTGSRAALFDFDQDRTPDGSGDPFGTFVTPQTFTVTGTGT